MKFKKKVLQNFCFSPSTIPNSNYLQIDLLWTRDGTLTGITIRFQSSSANNNNEGVIHVLHCSKTIASSSDAV